MKAVSLTLSLATGLLICSCSLFHDNSLDAVSYNDTIINEQSKIVMNIIAMSDNMQNDLSKAEAKRLEGIAPMMRYKGRIQIGADADITIFNPDTVIDKATFEKGLAFSEGIEYVMVNGVFVLKNGKTITSVFPGQPVYGKYKK